jgi:hypothetical protein
MTAGPTPVSEAPHAVAPLPAAAPSAPPVAQLPLRAAVARSGESEVALAASEPTVVPTGASFRVEVEASIPDGRLSLRDEQDAMVPTSGSTEVGALATVFLLAPEAPLQPGTVYTLHLDGADRHEPVDRTGRRYRPAVLAIKTAGERPPPVAKRKTRRR